MKDSSVLNKNMKQNSVDNKRFFGIDVANKDMKQNPDRMWFDKGYRRGQRDAKQEAFWPKILGITFILILAWVSFPIAVAVFFCYFLLGYSVYRDRNKGKDIQPPPLIKE